MGYGLLNIQIQPRLKAKLSVIFKVCSNKIYNRVMLSGKGNENGEKNNNRSNQHLSNHVQHNFYVHFFAVVLHDYNVKLPETSQLHGFQRKCRTCSRSLIFHCRSFSLCIGDRQHYFMLSLPLQNFHVVLPTKKASVSFVFLSLALDLYHLFCR